MRAIAGTLIGKQAACRLTGPIKASCVVRGSSEKPIETGTIAAPETFSKVSSFRSKRIFAGVPRSRRCCVGCRCWVRACRKSEERSGGGGEECAVMSGAHEVRKRRWCTCCCGCFCCPPAPPQSPSATYSQQQCCYVHSSPQLYRRAGCTHKSPAAQRYTTLARPLARWGTKRCAETQQSTAQLALHGAARSFARHSSTPVVVAPLSRQKSRATGRGRP